MVTRVSVLRPRLFLKTYNEVDHRLVCLCLNKDRPMCGAQEGGYAVSVRLGAAVLKIFEN